MSQPKIPPSLDYFLICEDIREEAGNKVSLLGVFVGGDVQFSRGDFREGISLSSLSIFAKFSNGSGVFKQRLVISSGDAVIAEVPGEEVTLKASSPHTVRIQMRPFPVPSLGVIKFKIYFDEILFELPVEFKEAPPS